MTTTGFTRAAARSALMNRRASSTASMYSMMLSVAASWTRKSRISLRPTSAPMPVEITVENPTWRPRAQSSIALQSAPDCETSASLPVRAWSGPHAALSPVSVLTRPRLLGPTNRTPWRRAARLSSASSSSPAAPASRKPADTMTAPRMPFAPHSATIPGTVGAGVTMRARSTGWGRSLTLG